MTGIPVLVHWTAIAMFHIAVVGFAFALLCVLDVCAGCMCGIIFETPV